MAARRTGTAGCAPPQDGFITVDEFLDFCDATGCRPYYTINMQGGTEGKEGPVPPDASLDEKIRYKHAAPNPCGYPPTSYYYGTLAETVQLVEKYTVQRLLEGKTPILDYEMGNENWGQATSDWPSEVYVRTVEVYARAMREVLQRAKAQNPGLPPASLRITAVGYPVMGNNQDPQQATRYDIDVAWTQGLNRLHELGPGGRRPGAFLPLQQRDRRRAGVGRAQPEQHHPHPPRHPQPAAARLRGSQAGV